MRKRLSSTMDTRRKKTGLVVICALLLSMMIVGGMFVVQAQVEESNLCGYPQYNSCMPRHFRGVSVSEEALAVNGLIGVVGINGVVGWSYARELYLFWDTPINNPEEALVYMQKLRDFTEEHGNTRYINVYDYDGVTIIDKFRMEVIPQFQYGNR